MRRGYSQLHRGAIHQQAAGFDRVFDAQSNMARKMLFYSRRTNVRTFNLLSLSLGVGLVLCHRFTGGVHT